MVTQNPGHTQHRKTHQAEHNGETKFHRSNDILRETIQEFKERGDDLRTLASEYVKEKPVRALSIALLTGMALALIIRR